MITRCCHWLVRISLLGLAAAGAAEPVAKTTYSSDQLMTEMTRLVTAHFRVDGDWNLNPVRGWTPPSQAAQTWQLAVTEFPSLPASTMLVHFRLLADGALVEDTSILLSASLMRSVWFARQPVTAHTIFNSGDLTTRLVDALRERDALPASAGDDSYIFTRDIPADGLLTWHDLARRPLVRRGDLVDVTASEGSLSVTMKGQALENGAQGDQITVRNLDSHKDISALVVSENRVEVHF
jgi:flagellar basal body P-ring formation protein FlgA